METRIFTSTFLRVWNEAKKPRNVNAQFELAKFYFRCKDASATQKAIDLCKKATKTGHTEASFALGMCYEFGYGVKRNYTAAIRRYKDADDHLFYDYMGDSQNPKIIEENKIAKQYFEDEEFADVVDIIMEKDEETFESDEKAAIEGDARAQNALGHRYYFGRDVEKNYEKAKYWYKKSAEAGFEAGISHYAQCCEKDRKFREAAKWYRLNAENNISYRIAKLGW